MSQGTSIIWKRKLMKVNKHASKCVQCMPAGALVSIHVNQDVDPSLLGRDLSY